MSTEFQSFLNRIRAGDPGAAQQLVAQYETELRIIARARLRDSRVRRTVDSSDICQSVFASFFVRAAAGQYDLESPEDLIKLLAQMVRNKATGQLRKQRASRRDVAKQAADGVDEMAIPSGDHTPSRIFAARELVERFQGCLPDEIREISELRSDGKSWEEIAIGLDTSPEAVRKRFSRAVDKAAVEAGIDEM